MIDEDIKRIEKERSEGLDYLANVWPRDYANAKDPFGREIMDLSKNMAMQYITDTGILLAEIHRLRGEPNA